VLANSSGAYKSFREAFPNSPYAQAALRLQAQPKNIPLMQFTRLTRPATNIGLSNNHAPSLASSKSATLPAKITNLQAKDNYKTNHNTNATSFHGKNQFHESGAPRRFGGGMGGNSGPRFSQSRSSFGSMGGHGGGGGFRRGR
jgi:hypothetical protein